MSRFRGSFVACGLIVALACSFEVARAKDKDPKQPGSPVGGQSAGGNPSGAGGKSGQGQAPSQGTQKQTIPSAPRDVGKSPGTPLQPFQPNKGSGNFQSGKSSGGSGVPVNNGGLPSTGGAAGGIKVNAPGTPGQPRGNSNSGVGKSSGPAIPGGLKIETAKPAGGVGPAQTGVGKTGTLPGGSFVPGRAGVNTGKATGNPAGTFGGFDPNGRGSIGKPKISVEPGAGKQTLGGKGNNLPFDPKGTVKLNPRPEPLGLPRPGAQLSGPEKMKPLVVSKNGKPTLNLPKGGTPSTGDKIGTDKQTDPQKDDKFHSLLQAKKRDDLNRELKAFKIAENESPRSQERLGLKHLNLDKVSGVHQERLAKLDNFQDWQQSKAGQKLGLKQQFELQRQGDLSRRLNLNSNLINAGGWAQHRQHGVIAASFTTSAFSCWYAGGGCYPAHCWCPAWSPWVDWSCWGTCPILYDPRPYFCIPILYGPCVPWVYYDYPVWNPLPFVACGTWIDVSPVIVVAGQDVQLLAVRFVDNGHPEQNLGSRYRIWVRNNSPVQIVMPFSVLLLASNELTPTVELPQSGVVIPSMDIGETQILDIRLPLAANRLGTTPEGYRVPFTYLHVLVDSHQQIPETFEDNNGAVLARKDILPVDPAAFSTDLTVAAPESVLTIAGEGFGPEPGQVIVSVYGQQVQAEIQGWYDLGIRFTVPNFALTQPVDAEVLVVRGDSAVSNPLTVRLAPRELIEEAPAFPDSPIPEPPQ